MITEDEACRFLSRGLHNLGINPLPAPRLSQLWRYFSELKKWNRKMNLVGQAPDQDLLENHFLDSLALLSEITAGPLLDVGSGAGFPGLVLKIACPELPVTLLEPRQKRVSFLRHIIRSLGLTAIEVVEERLVEGDRTFSQRHGDFPLITCRALAEIGPFLTLIEAASPPQGQVFCMKGPRADEELAAWRLQSPSSPFVLDRCVRFSLPFSGADRNLVIFKKA